MMAENKYLEKIALRRVISEIAKGNVTTNLATLARKGVIKPKSVYEKGMALGNKNIAAKSDIKMQHPRTDWDKLIASQGGGYSAKISSKTNKPVVLVGGSPKTNGYHNAFVRHELFEGHDLKRIANQSARSFRLDDDAKSLIKEHMGSSYNPKHIESHKFVKADSFSNGDHVVGMHATPRVLSRESEMIRKNPYLRGFRQYRENTGEASIITRITGKRFGMDKMGPNDHNKAFRASNLGSDSPYPSFHKDHKV